MKCDELDPFRGIKTWRDTEDNILRVRLHRSADPLKWEGTPEGKRFVQEGIKNAPSLEWWKQEQEIDFGARQGSRVYDKYRDDATQLVDPFPIPEHWNRYHILDTHRRVPHASLWVAVSPENIPYAYREFWPSKVYGNGKPVPEDDDRWPIDWYASVIKYLESAENTGVESVEAGVASPSNENKNEKIYRRIIDYSARAFGKDDQNPDAVDYQKLYEQAGDELNHPFYFEDCVKDNEAAYQRVNDLLMPKPEIGSNGDIIEKSTLRIFRNLRELRWELLHNRLQLLQPHQQDVKDPDFKVVQKKNNLSDCCKYFAMCDWTYHAPRKVKSTAAPLAVR